MTHPSGGADVSAALNRAHHVEEAVHRAQSAQDAEGNAQKTDAFRKLRFFALAGCASPLCSTRRSCLTTSLFFFPIFWWASKRANALALLHHRSLEAHLPGLSVSTPIGLTWSLHGYRLDGEGRPHQSKRRKVRAPLILTSSFLALTGRSIQDTCGVRRLTMCWCQCRCLQACEVATCSCSSRPRH